MRNTVLFCKDLNETVESVDNLTMDELLSLYEEIEMREFIQAAQTSHERNKKN